jgi:hypothetical protein
LQNHNIKSTLTNQRNQRENIVKPHLSQNMAHLFQADQSYFKIQIISLNEHPDPIIDRVIGAWKEL